MNAESSAAIYLKQNNWKKL